MDQVRRLFDCRLCREQPVALRRLGVFRPVGHVRRRYGELDGFFDLGFPQRAPFLGLGAVALVSAASLIPIVVGRFFKLCEQIGYDIETRRFA